MSQNLTQPEEIEIVWQEMAKEEMPSTMTKQNQKNFHSTLESWHCGYVPPYRAAFNRAEA